MVPCLKGGGEHWRGESSRPGLGGIRGGGGPRHQSQVYSELFIELWGGGGIPVQPRWGSGGGAGSKRLREADLKVYLLC